MGVLLDVLVEKPATHYSASAALVGHVSRCSNRADGVLIASASPLDPISRNDRLVLHLTGLHFKRFPMRRQTLLLEELRGSHQFPRVVNLGNQMGMKSLTRRAQNFARRMSNGVLRWKLGQSEFLPARMVLLVTFPEMVRCVRT
jgi:hypothetical protein